jgi:hypothetical protein
MIKRRIGNQIGNLILDHKSHCNMGQIIFDWGVQYTIGNIFSRARSYCPRMLKKYLIWEKYECPKFRNNKNPSFEESQFWGLPLGSLKKKWHLDVALMENHKIYCKERSGASSQSLCLKLSLNLSHHLHSIYIYHLLSFIVLVDFILNSCLWDHSSPIPKFQHAFLPSKCYELIMCFKFIYFP